MNKILITLTLLMNVHLQINAQSVDDFILMSKDYNPGLKSMKLDYEAAKQVADQVDDWPDPQVSVGLGVFPIETRLGAQRLKIGVTQMIPWKGMLDAKGDLARFKAEEKSYDDEIKEIDIEFAIRSTYQMLLFLKDQGEIINDRLKVLDALEEIAKSAVRSGKGQLSNVLFVERKREMLNADFGLLKDQQDAYEVKLNIWAGRAVDEEIILQSAESIPFQKEEELRFATSEHPIYSKLQSQIHSSEQAAALTSFDSKPKIGVGLDYGLIVARPDVDIPNNGRDVLMPMGSISIPLNKGKYKAKRQEEAIKQEATKAKMQEISDMYKMEIESTYEEIEYLNSIISKFQSLQVITKETLKLMRNEYASEGTRFEELLRVEMELIDYQYQILQASFQIGLKKALLMKYK